MNFNTETVNIQNTVRQS